MEINSNYSTLSGFNIQNTMNKRAAIKYKIRDVRKQIERENKLRRILNEIEENSK